jgi:hypothetical protein
VNASRLTAVALVAIVLIGCALRLYDIRNPILDHPGWRQGDQAAIARNFAQLRNDILYPQVDYDGPPPNYIELELQIVPFAAAQLYKAFGVHVGFGRLIVVFFSLGTILLVYWFALELASPRAGLAAALLLAIAPGAIYYGRTFTPDSVMVFFSTGVLLFWWRWCMRRAPADLVAAVAFGALAWLAKPPALLVLLPILGVLVARRGWRAFIDWSLYAFLALTLVPFVLYFNHVSAIAEWHWFSGITQKHVLPALWTALSSPAAFYDAVRNALALLDMLAHTILGPVLLALMLAGALLLPDSPVKRERGWLFATWAAALCAYAFVVVNVQRVDYYLLPWLPLAVLVAGVAIDGIWQRVVQRPVAVGAWVALAAAVFITGYIDMLELAPYYVWNPRVYASATLLDRELAPGSIIVMGHYGPDVLYLINRKGWEEDPALWTVHDMKSAIAKGARYFVAVEGDRLRTNPELFTFLERFPKVAPDSGWPVYDFAKR